MNTTSKLVAGLPPVMQGDKSPTLPLPLPSADVDLEHFRRRWLPLLLPLGLWFVRGPGLARPAFLVVPPSVFVAASPPSLSTSFCPRVTWHSWLANDGRVRVPAISQFPRFHTKMEHASLVLGRRHVVFDFNLKNSESYHNTGSLAPRRGEAYAGI